MPITVSSLRRVLGRLDEGEVIQWLVCLFSFSCVTPSTWSVGLAMQGSEDEEGVSVLTVTASVVGLPGASTNYRYTHACGTVSRNISWEAFKLLRGRFGE